MTKKVKAAPPEVQRQVVEALESDLSAPDASQYIEGPWYLRALWELSGLSQEALGERIGIPGRTMRRYLSVNNVKPHRYPVQYAVECLVQQRMRELEEE